MAEIIKTMGGILTFAPGNHRYTWNGEKVDLTVSAVAAAFAVPFGAASGWAAKVIREELLRGDIPTSFDGPSDRLEWAKRVCKSPHQVTKRAGEIGTAVHRYIEEGGRVELSDDEDIAMCQRSLGEWVKSTVREVISTERRLYSRKWRIAGTVDMVAKMRDKKTCVIDWKGVTDLDASLKPGHVAQLTAYRSMLEEAGEEIDGCILVRFSRATGKVDAMAFRHHEENVAAFEAALALARYKPRPEVF
tara:strand:+ start:1335 stop:2075 length:741 start_codon:yes stop_codon:yes gene_type:complete